MHIGNRIREARKAKGWTQAQLAERSGLTQAAVSRIESRPDTQTATVRRVCGPLGLDLELVQT